MRRPRPGLPAALMSAALDAASAGADPPTFRRRRTPRCQLVPGHRHACWMDVCLRTGAETTERLIAVLQRVSVAMFARAIADEITARNRIPSVSMRRCSSGASRRPRSQGARVCQIGRGAIDHSKGRVAARAFTGAPGEPSCAGA